jgi:hypothetical protein
MSLRLTFLESTLSTVALLTTAFPSSNYLRGSSPSSSLVFANPPFTNFFFFGFNSFESDEILAVLSSFLPFASAEASSADPVVPSVLLSTVFSSVLLSTEFLFSTVSPLTSVFLSVASLVGSLRATD